ncbi:hypothetical protein T439DRAFT_325251 [Meredithblackwellia eburnea MCA 4105]
MDSPSKQPIAAPRACSECARRKGKCDKQIPCSKCIARGVPHLCRVDIPKPPPTAELPLDLDREGLRALALDELLRLRQNAQDTAARITRLEALFSRAFSTTFPENESPTSYSTTSPDVPPVASTSSIPSPPLRSHYPSSHAAVALPPLRTSGMIERTKPSPSGSSPSAGRLPASKTGPSPIATDLEVDATQALEYLALGRQQELSSGENNVNQSSSSSLPPDPITQYPTLSSIAAVAPTRAQADILITFCLSSLSWQLSVLHAPTFMEEYSLFWSKGPNGFVGTQAAWLALYFALLTVGVNLATMEERMLLGMSEEQCIELSKRWAPCATSLLYRSDFVERHSLHALQTISVYAHGGRDIWATNLISSLRSVGLAIAVETNLHRMVSNETWEQLMADQPKEARIKNLIHRETCKRVFWSLCREDWYSINWRKTYTLRPAQISTPQPLNVHDHDLSAGYSQGRPPSDYTVMAWSLAKIQLARFLQHAFQYTNATPEESYQVILDTDQQFDVFMGELPSWWKGGPPAPNMPSKYKWFRSAFVIAAYHKLLALHRPFINRDDPQYEPSRRRAVFAVRTILREAPMVGECRIWIVLYQISVACFISLRDLFQNSTPWSPAMEEQRREIINALPILEAAKEWSGISRRGFDLVSRILEDESKFRQLPYGVSPASSASPAPIASRPAETELVHNADRDLLFDESLYQSNLLNFDPYGLQNYTMQFPWVSGEDGTLDVDPASFFGQVGHGGMQVE